MQAHGYFKVEQEIKLHSFEYVHSQTIGTLRGH
jgi:hypothetical protein